MPRRSLLPALALLAACGGHAPPPAAGPIPISPAPAAPAAPAADSAASAPAVAQLPGCAERVGAATSPGAGGRRRPLFEFEVEHAAEYTSGTSIAPPRPTRAGSPRARAIAQFVVDAAGRVDTTAIRIVETRGMDSTAAVVALRAAAPRWRYRPATLDGCYVAQVVQSPVEF